jgi:hypothetical protein
MKHTRPIAVLLLQGLLAAAALSVPLVPSVRGAEPLLLEGFDDPGALSAWESVEGARTGDGAASIVTLEGGALRLAGGPTTQRWMAVQRTVPLNGAQWIRLGGRMRTEGVDPGGARYVNSNLYLRFSDGPVLRPRLMTGTNLWTPVAMRYRVPEGAQSVTVGCFLSLPGRAWFDDLRLEAVAEEWRTEPAGVWRYHLLPGDAISAEARAYNDESVRLMQQFFGHPGPGTIDFHKYPGLELKEEYTGRAGNAHVQDGAIHSIWPADRHEIVHLYAAAWGDPPALLAEGLAVHLSGWWQDRSVGEAAARVLAEGRWIPLGELLDTRQFRARPDDATYPQAGAFAGWLLQRLGPQKLRRLYGRLSNTAAAEQNRKVFEDLVGLRLEQADGALRKSLKSGD